MRLFLSSYKRKKCRFGQLSQHLGKITLFLSAFRFLSCRYLFFSACKIHEWDVNRSFTVDWVFNYNIKLIVCHVSSTSSHYTFKICFNLCVLFLQILCTPFMLVLLYGTGLKTHIYTYTYAHALYFFTSCINIKYR